MAADDDEGRRPAPSLNAVKLGRLLTSFTGADIVYQPKFVECAAVLPLSINRCTILANALVPCVTFIRTEEWLQHSRKKQCEICNYPFSFTPIYSDHAPDRISIPFFLSIVSGRFFTLAKFYLRLFLAASIWLVGVPYVTVWIWRMHFRPAALVSQVKDTPWKLWSSLSFEAVLSLFTVSNLNNTLVAGDILLSKSNSTLLANGTIVDSVGLASQSDLYYRRIISTFFTDVLEGQIIASIAVVICLAFLCLKEYVVMNTPVDGQGNPINVPEAPAAEPVEAFPPPRPIFGRRDLLPLNDVRPPPEVLAALHGRQENPQVLPEQRGPLEAHGPALADTALHAHESDRESDWETDDGSEDDSLKGKDETNLNLVEVNSIEVNLATDGFRRRSVRLQEQAVAFAPLEEPTRRSLSHPRTSLTQTRDPMFRHPYTTRSNSEAALELPDGSLLYPQPQKTEVVESVETEPYQDHPSEFGLLERERKLISAAAYDEQQYRRRHSGIDHGKGKGPEEDARPEVEEFPRNRPRQSRLERAQTDYDLGMRRLHSSASSLSRSRNRSDSLGEPAIITSQRTSSLSSFLSEGSPNPRHSDGSTTSSLSSSQDLSGVEDEIRGRSSTDPGAPEQVDVAPKQSLSSENDGGDRTSSEDGYTGEDLDRMDGLPLAVEAFQPPAALAPLPQVVAVVPEPAPPVPPQVPADADEPMNIGNNDVNAFLELVGVQGPLETLMQNVVMVILIISVALFIGVWIPYWIGRGVTYLVKEIYSPSLDWAITKLQSLTDPLLDPVVDAALLTAKMFGFRLVKKEQSSIIIPSRDKNRTVMASIPVNFTDEFNEKLPLALDVPDQMSENTKPNTSVVFVSTTPLNATVNGSRDTEASDLHNLLHGKPGRQYAKEKTSQKVFGIPEKLLFTCIGYLTEGFFIVDYARRTGLLQNPYAQTMKRITLKWLLYFVMGTKFTFFLTVELGLFPLFCGVLIDICTLPLFGPHASLESRWTFYQAYPWTSEFLHWVAGTTFMFQFALYISTVREIVRPGVMWFIRDPNDEQFHPMNDILERPVLTQLRKLAVGTVMYATIVVGGVGGVVGMIWCWDNLLWVKSGPSVMWPLQWDLSEPMSEFPVDLLIFHFVVPWTIAWIRPKRILKRIVAAWFKWTAARLRLTSFLLAATPADESDDEANWEDLDPPPRHGAGHTKRAGVRLDRPPLGGDPLDAHVHSSDDAHPRASPVVHDSGEDGDDEEDEIPDPGQGDSVEHPTPLPKTQGNVRPQREFRYMRVPNNDHVEVIPGERMLIPMREHDPIIGRDGETPEEIKLNWTKVYVPEGFKIRIAVLLYLQWICGVALVAGMIMVPLYIGRRFFIEATAHLPRIHLAPMASSVNATMPLNATALDAGTSTNAFPLNTTVSNLTLSVLAGSTANITSSLANMTSAVPRANGTTAATVRQILRPDLPVHDMYSYAAGLFLVFVTVYPILQIWRYISMWRRSPIRTIAAPRRLGRGRSDVPLEQARIIAEPIEPQQAVPPHRAARRLPWRRLARRWMRNGARWLVLGSKILFLCAMFGIVLPLMEGVVFDLYLIQPFKPVHIRPPALDNTQHTRLARHTSLDLTNPLARTIFQALLQDWALGAVYMKIAWALVMLGPETEVQRVLREFVDNGVRRVRVRPVWRTVILPLVSVCVALAAVPLAAGLLVNRFLLAESPWSQHVLRWIFPAALVLGLLVGGAYLSVGAIGRWMETIREEHFLVGRKLHNLEDRHETPSQPASPTGTSLPPTPHEPGIPIEEVLPLDAAPVVDLPEVV
ncbi:hypothetical protein HKX48_005361 [Thoreauomyces humboldtii]|nr:hypothetical protein HKX48_005361 [Thoreauomyces humboldtii]